MSHLDKNDQTLFWQDRWGDYRNGLFGTVTDASSVSPTKGLIPVHVGADEPIDGSASETSRGLTIRFGEWHISLQGELDPAIVQMLLSAVAR